MPRLEKGEVARGVGGKPEYKQMFVLHGDSYGPFLYPMD